MSSLFPSQVKLDPDEISRANRVQIALLLHKLPSEVDEMPASDVDDILHVVWAERKN